MDLLNGQLGPEASYDVNFSQGKLVVSSKYSGVQAGAQLSISVDAGLLLDVLAQKIPGTIPGEIISLVKAAIQAIP